MLSVSVLIIYTIGIALSKKRLIVTELIFPAMCLMEIAVILSSRGVIIGGTSTVVLVSSQMWVFVMWVTGIVWFKTDYLTSIWRPIVQGGFLFYLIFTRAMIGAISFPQMVFVWCMTIQFFELVHYKELLSMSQLFLKSEVAKKQAHSTKKVFYEVPDGILITQHQTPSNVMFHNHKFI